MINDNEQEKPVFNNYINERLNDICSKSEHTYNFALKNGTTIPYESSITEDEKRIIDALYNEIRSYIRKQLIQTNDSGKKSPIILFDGIRREVVMLTIDKEYRGRRATYLIPSKDKIESFKQAWIDVFLGCLNYYEQKLKKDGSTFIRNGNIVIIDKKQYRFNNILQYINTLEFASKENDMRKQNTGVLKVSKSTIDINSEKVKPSSLQSEILKEAYKKTKPQTIPKINLEAAPVEAPKETKKPTFSQKTITIENPEEKENIFNNLSLKKTYPKGDYAISKNTLNQALENEMETKKSTRIPSLEPIKEVKTEIKEKPKERPRRFKVNRAKLNKMRTERIVYSKLSDDEILDVDECLNLKEKPLVLIPTDISNKTETFEDNIYLLQENIPHVPIGLFVSGKMTNPEKLKSEALKIMKLANKTCTSRVIFYEVNNKDLINYKPNELLETFKAIEKLCGFLKEEGYYPLICADLDVRKKIINAILSLESNHKLSYPLFTRISSRQLDDIDENMDVIVMDPRYETDQVITTEATAKYINYALNTNTKTKTSSRVAA